MTDKKLATLISEMTLLEKATMCSGMDAWHTVPIPRLGIPSLAMCDGPHGTRVVDTKHAKINGGPSKPGTCFPPEVTLACSWDPQLAGRVGAAIAEECIAEGFGVILGPGVNIKRSPFGGRNFEYYSEDPLLSGKLAAGFINGVQQKGVGTSLKHYAVNNQENWRMNINAAVDERALHDIYLKPFEIAVKEAQPDTVMASYNKVRGHYATENRRLLNEVLRLRFGFKGVVLTDWGAVNNRVAALAAGCDLEMPYSGKANTKAIVRAVESGFLSEDVLDTAVWNLLRLVFRRCGTTKPVQPAACDWNAHHAVAVDALCKSAVLLKNKDAMLPLSGMEGRVAVIGEMAESPRFQGCGSSLVNPKKLVSFLSAMKTAGHSFVYAPGYETDGSASAQRIQAAVTVAAASSKVLLFLGLPDAYECEGYDRDSLALPAGQLKLLEAVCAANPNVVVVLSCGSPVATPWVKKVKALLCLHLGGQGVGEAAVRLLYGQCSPAGKLAESWPLSADDVPCAHSFPMGPQEVRYTESIYVGYRYYDTAGTRVQFPFGYGLSYTSFSYSNLVLSSKKLEDGVTLTARFTIKNTGAVAGDEIAQLYIKRENSAFFQAEKELVGFGRVQLEPGEEKELAVDIPPERLSFHDATTGATVVEQGAYTLLCGASSRDIRLRAGFEVAGAVLSPAGIYSAGGPYATPKDNCFPEESFEKLYGKAFISNTLPEKGQFGAATPLGVMAQQSRAARRVLSLAQIVAKQTMRFSQDPAAAKKSVQAATYYLPFKNLALNTIGILSPAASEELLAVFNGRHRMAQMLINLILRR